MSNNHYASHQTSAVSPGAGDHRGRPGEVSATRPSSQVPGGTAASSSDRYYASREEEQRQTPAAAAGSTAYARVTGHGLLAEEIGEAVRAATSGPVTLLIPNEEWRLSVETQLDVEENEGNLDGEGRARISIETESEPEDDEDDEDAEGDWSEDYEESLKHDQAEAESAGVTDTPAHHGPGQETHHGQEEGQADDAVGNEDPPSVESAGEGDQPAGEATTGGAEGGEGEMGESAAEPEERDDGNEGEEDVDTI